MAEPSVDGEDPRITHLIDMIDAEMEFTPILDRQFTDENVYLDGRFWDRCTFTRCRITSRAGMFRMGKCAFVDAKSVVLHGPAARIYALLQANQEMGGKVEIAMTGHKESDPGARA